MPGSPNAALRLATPLLVASLAACASPNAEVEMRTARGERLKIELPRGYPAPIVDPSDTIVGWPDLRYANDPNAPPTQQCLDLLTPKSVLETLRARADGASPEEAPLGQRPLIVFIHGGTWSAGDKRGGLDLKAGPILASGFLFTTINYRLAPDFKHPAQIEDTAAALAWLHQHVAEYGGSPDRFVLVGHSAGAHLAALVATDERWLAKHGLPLTLIAGAVSLDGGGYDLGRRTQGEPMSERVLGSVFGHDRAVWADASPVNHVAAGKGVPPFLLFQAGDRDVSIEETAIFADALTKAGLPFEVVREPEKTHRSIHREFGAPDDAVMAKVLEFAHQVTGTTAPEPAAPSASAPTSGGGS